MTRAVPVVVLAMLLTACQHSRPESGFTIDCRNGQTWTIPATMNDARDFMKELAKCPGAVRLRCKTQAECDHAPIFVPWSSNGRVIRPMTQEEIDKTLR